LALAAVALAAPAEEKKKDDLQTAAGGVLGKNQDYLS